MPDIDAGTVFANLAVRTDNLFTGIDGAIDKLSQFGDKGQDAINTLNKSLENITGLSKYQAQVEKTTTAYEAQKNKVAEMAAELKDLQQLQDKGMLSGVALGDYQTLTTSIRVAKEALSEYKTEMEQAKDAADVYILSQQESAVATAEQKVASLEAKEALLAQKAAAQEAAAAQTQGTTLATGALSMGLRSLSSISGGAVSNLSDMYQINTQMPIGN